jgi:glucose-6-phosphate isomerase
LESLRRNVRRLFNKNRRDQTTHSWELYREDQQAYRKEVRKVSKETWRAFCTSINDLPRAARLHRALSKDPKVRLGSWCLPQESVRSLRRKLLTSS